MPTRQAAKWSAEVTEHSHALDVPKGLFTWRDPKRIARSLKQSAEEAGNSPSPYRSAISLLTFYVNRAGKTLTTDRLRTLKRAKEELRRQFGRPPKAVPHSHVARRRRALPAI